MVCDGRHLSSPCDLQFKSARDLNQLRENKTFSLKMFFLPFLIIFKVVIKLRMIKVMKTLPNTQTIEEK